MTRGWGWTAKAYRWRDNLIAGACLIGCAGVIALMFIMATN